MNVVWMYIRKLREIADEKEKKGISSVLNSMQTEEEEVETDDKYNIPMKEICVSKETQADRRTIIIIFFLSKRGSPVQTTKETAVGFGLGSLYGIPNVFCSALTNVNKQLSVSGSTITHSLSKKGFPSADS